MPFRRWNTANGFWYIPKNRFNLNKFIECFNPDIDIDFSALEIPQDQTSPGNASQNNSPQCNKSLNENIKDIPAEYLEMLFRKRYSPNTINTYISYMKALREEFSGRDLDTINTREINDYLSSLIRTKDISSSQQNQRISAIKFYYEKSWEERKLIAV